MKLALCLLALVSLCSCAVTSTEFVEDQFGFSRTRGRIADIANLHSEELERLSDGIAITVRGDGCDVTFRFDDDQSREFRMASGSILVFGEESDFLLEPILEPGS